MTHPTRSTRFVLSALLAVLVLPSHASSQTASDTFSAVTETDQWTVPVAPRVYTPTDLTDAPEIAPRTATVIEDYGFRSLADGRIVESATGTEVGVRIFEMTDSAAAFGLFGFLRDRRSPDFAPATVGTESFLQNGSLHVWQASHVLVLSGPRVATLSLARTMTPSIFGDSRKPPVSLVLPRRNLIADSEKYLLNAEAFAESTGLEPEALGFEDSVEVALGEYEDGSGGSARLAMLLYPTSHVAARHEETWLSGDAPIPAYARSGPALAIALDGAAPGENTLADSVLGDVIYRSEVTWNEPPPDPLTISGLILTVFAWIGIAILFTTIVGIAFGGVRIYMKTRYPERFLGTSPDAEYIQLKLNQSLTDAGAGHRPALEPQTKQNQ